MVVDSLESQNYPLLTEKKLTVVQLSHQNLELVPLAVQMTALLNWFYSPLDKISLHDRLVHTENTIVVSHKFLYETAYSGGTFLTLLYL